MKKKCLVLLLALMLSVSACGKEPEVSGSNDSTTVESQDENDVDEGTEAEQESEPVVEAKVSVAENFTYTEENGEITITGYEGDATVLEIPESINGMPVVAIGKDAFMRNYTLRKVYIPDSVTLVGAGAFSGCVNLKNVDLGNSIVEISSSAFGCCGIRNIEFPDTLIELGGSSFGGAQLETLVFPPGIEVINARSFADTNITEVTIPSSVIWVGLETFQDCKNLKKVVFEEGVEFIDEDAFSGCTALESITLPSTLVVETDINAFRGAGSEESNLTIYVPADCAIKDAILETYGNEYNIVITE